MALMFSMIAESVSKAASGADLGVDDTRFEEMMADVDDDEEDDFLSGKVSKRVRLLPILFSTTEYCKPS